MNASILISSCDKYSGLWDPFFYLFFRYWKDCPYDIYLLTNNIKYPDHRVTTITVGQDKGWASNLTKSLRAINTKYLLYLQEDYFIKSKVPTKEIVKIIDQVTELNCGYLRLQPNPQPNLPYFIENIGEISKNTPYRVSLQAALWKKQTLEKLLVEGESGWDMEILGSERSNNIDDLFLSIKKKPLIPYLWRTAIQKGKWTLDAQILCFFHRIKCSDISFEKESIKDWGQKKIRKSIKGIKKSLISCS